MIQNTISIAGGVTRNPLIRLAQPVTVALSAGEHIAVVGPNGGGKSLLVDTLLGKYPLKEGSLVYDFSPSVTNTVYDDVKYIAFRDTYGAADANYYYQQRWNAHDQEDAPEVREMLGEIKDEVLKQELFELFRIEPMLDKKIILLSSGELRKFQLTKALLTSPRVLVMDNPFIRDNASDMAAYIVTNIIGCEFSKDNSSNITNQIMIFTEYDLQDIISCFIDVASDSESWKTMKVGADIAAEKKKEK